MPNIHVNENMTTVSLILYIWDLVYCVCKDIHFMVHHFPLTSRQNKLIIVKFEYFFFLPYGTDSLQRADSRYKCISKHNKHKYFRLTYISDSLLIFGLPIPFHSHCFKTLCTDYILSFFFAYQQISSVTQIFFAGYILIINFDALIIIYS